MSLISDALRKARREAAEDGPRRRGAAYSSTLMPDSGRSRLGLGFVLGGLITLGAAIAGGGLVWWALGHREQPEGIQQAATVIPPAVAPPAPASASLAAAPEPALEPAPSTGGSPRPQSLEIAAPEAGPVAPAAATPGDDDPDRLPPAGATSDDNPPATQPENAGDGPRERVFVLDAELGHASLHLDYIVFRPGAPFAGINDQEVVEGSIIEGFLVEAIGRDRVTLRDASGTVVLRVR